MEDNIKETPINVTVKGSSVPARNRLKTLPTFRPECTCLPQQTQIAALFSRAELAVSRYVRMSVKFTM